ncbi:MAG: hypothetical protein JO231_06215 [Acidobacteria bacterium]|nr:hypothetical protein [Acidobacteriota bacterium]
MTVSLDRLASHAYCAEFDPDFPTGRRAGLVFASPSLVGSYAKINAVGPDPAEYVEYAKADLVDGSMRGRINAVGNAKRAVHLSVDAVLKVLALDTMLTRAGFQTKLRLLAEIGAFPTRMVNSLNKRRNIIEHEYSEVSQDETLTLVEIAEMFVVFAYRFFRGATVGAYVAYVDDPRCVEWWIDPAERVLRRTRIDASLAVQSSRGPVYYNVDYKNRRETLEEVPLDDEHRPGWLPVLDLLIYCTRRRSLRLEDGVAAGEVVYQNVYVTHGEDLRFTMSSLSPIIRVVD